MTAKNDAEAVMDYVEAHKKYNDMLDEYIVVEEIIPGHVTKPSKVLTEKAILELDKLGNEVEEKRKIWMVFIKKS